MITFVVKNPKSNILRIFKDEINIGRIEWNWYDINKHQEYFGLDKKWVTKNISNNNILYINTIIIDPKYRDQGYGKQLLSYFLNFHKKSDYDSIFLESVSMETLKINPKIQNKLNKFYESFGFEMIYQNRDLTGLMYKKK